MIDEPTQEARQDELIGQPIIARFHGWCPCGHRILQGVSEIVEREIDGVKHWVHADSCADSDPSEFRRWAA